MPRFDANKIPYKKQDELMDSFCDILCKLQTKAAVRDFLKDLLNRQERIMLIRRIMIAELLLEEKTYREIREELGVGEPTIARVQRWLHFGRGGYKKAISKKKN